MQASPKRVIALAVRKGHIAMVLFVKGRVTDWRGARKDAKQTEHAEDRLRYWLAEYAPDTVIVEDAGTAHRKGKRQKAILRRFAEIAKASNSTCVLATRHQMHANKFLEAAALAKRFPALRRKVPKQTKAWQSEPMGLIYFEAVALALPYLDKDHE